MKDKKDIEVEETPTEVNEDVLEETPEEEASALPVNPNTPENWKNEPEVKPVEKCLNCKGTGLVFVSAKDELCTVCFGKGKVA